MDVSSLFAPLGLLVLERLPEGRFVRRGPLPRWTQSLRAEPIRTEAPFDIETIFPFLGAFLEQAESAWQGEPGTRVSSDFWTEVGQNGEEVHLEAAAVRLDHTSVLVIARNNRLFVQQRLVLQRARELRLVHDELMREFELKDILVHAIVHDLAAPLHSILGVLSLLDEQSPPEPTRRWIQIALHAALRQRQLVQEILDVFSAEKSDLTQAPVAGAEAPQLGQVISLVMNELDPVVRSRGIRLETEFHGPDWKVVAEETRLFRVLTNLLDNALRSSPDGGTIRLVVSSEKDSLYVRVEDEGPGVPLEVLPRLFEKFAKGGARRGTGLGLYFCRITLERWGGGIGYEPRAEGGARFWIRLRRSDAPANGERRGQPADR
jgi:signal transduction histidine kinase